MDILAEYVPVFLTFFIVIDPLGVSVVFIPLTAGYSPKKKRLAAVRAPLIAFCVLALFIFFGPGLISALGILPGSLYIAGGVLLFLISIDMLFGKPRRTKNAAEGEDDEADITVFPLALPLLSGPGAITAVLLYLSDSGSRAPIRPLALLAVVGVVLLITVVALLTGDLLTKILRKTGVSVIERIMGILLSGMSVQFVYSGLTMLGIVH